MKTFLPSYPGLGPFPSWNAKHMNGACPEACRVGGFGGEWFWFRDLLVQGGGNVRRCGA